MTFRTHYTQDDLQEYIEHAAAKPADEALQDPWYERKFALAENVFGAKLFAYLKEKRGAGALKPFPNASGYGSHFVSAWNALASGNLGDRSEDELWDDITNRFGQFFWATLDGAIAQSKNGMPPVSLDQMYDHLVELVDAGTFSWSRLSIKDDCWITGKSLHTEFRGWEPVLGGLDFKGLRAEFRVLPSLDTTPRVCHLEIDLKTGNLLVADWFRISEFNAAVKNNTLPSVNSEAGREALTRYYASEHNFISVSVGNTSPRIFTDGEIFVAGGEQECFTGKDAYRVAGRVDTEYWGVTLIEEEQLLAIIAKTAGADRARELVDECLNEYDVERIQVKPGKYHLYFHPSGTKFAADLAEHEFDLKNVTAPRFVLSPRALARTPAATARQPFKP